MKYASNGVLFCLILNRVNGKQELIKGVEKQPRNAAAIRSNINKALVILRKLPRFSGRYLWSGEEIRGGDEEVIWGLLGEIQEYYMVLKKSGQGNCNNTLLRGMLTSPSLRFDESTSVTPDSLLPMDYLRQKSETLGIYSSYTSNHNSKSRFSILNQTNDTNISLDTHFLPPTPNFPEIESEVLTWLTSLNLYINHAENFLDDPMRNGVILCHLASLLQKYPLSTVIEKPGNVEDVMQNLNNALVVMSGSGVEMFGKRSFLYACLQLPKSRYGGVIRVYQRVKQGLDEGRQHQSRNNSPQRSLCPPHPTHLNNPTTNSPPRHRPPKSKLISDSLHLTTISSKTQPRSHSHSIAFSLNESHSIIQRPFQRNKIVPTHFLKVGMGESENGNENYKEKGSVLNENIQGGVNYNTVKFQVNRRGRSADNTKSIQNVITGREKPARNPKATFKPKPNSKYAWVYSLGLIPPNLKSMDAYEFSLFIGQLMEKILRKNLGIVEPRTRGEIGVNMRKVMRILSKNAKWPVHLSKCEQEILDGNISIMSTMLDTIHSVYKNTIKTLIRYNKKG